MENYLFAQSSRDLKINAQNQEIALFTDLNLNGDIEICLLYDYFPFIYLLCINMDIGLYTKSSKQNNILKVFGN